MAAQFRVLLVLPCLLGFYLHSTHADKCFSCLQADPVMLKKLEQEEWGAGILTEARGANLTTHCSTVDPSMGTCERDKCLHMHIAVTAFEKPFDVGIRNCRMGPREASTWSFIRNSNFSAYFQICHGQLCNSLPTDELRKATRGAAGTTSTFVIFIAIISRFVTLF